MEAFLTILELGIWKSVEDGYTMTNTPLRSEGDIKEYENNFKARNVILRGLLDSELVKVMSCKTTKEV